VELFLTTLKARKKRATNAGESKKDQTGLQMIDEPIVNIELMTLKDFLKVFKSNKFGERACNILTAEFHMKLED
jgi:hypothetical protein